jgi:hypothetical protein
MYLVAIAWIYVVLMMAVAEAMSPQGSLLGAFFTLLLYGALPLGIVLYLMGTPHRRRARLAAEAAEAATPVDEADAAIDATSPVSASASTQAPDRHGEPATDTVAPVRKEA